MLELSWYGDAETHVSLGGAFHSGRLAVRASQVGTVAAARRGRRTTRDRLALALELLRDPAFDVLLTGESRFDELPDGDAAARRRRPAGALPHPHLRDGVDAVFSVTVRDHMMVAHSLRGEVFGPAQRLHGATFVVDATFRRDRLDGDGIVVDIGRAAEELPPIVGALSYRNLDDDPHARRREHHDRGAGRSSSRTGWPTRVRDGALGEGARELAAIAVTLHESPRRVGELRAGAYDRDASHAVVPEGLDDPDRPSGGNAYDRRLLDGLRTHGWSVHEHAVPGAWPRPDAGRPRRAGPGGRRGPGRQRAARGRADRVGGGRGAGAQCSSRVRLVVLVHMPLGPEEREVLESARAVLTTSAWTRGWLVEHRGLRAERLHVAEPGCRGGGSGAGHAHRRRAALRRGGHPAQGPRGAAVGARDRHGPALAVHPRRLAGTGSRLRRPGPGAGRPGRPRGPGQLRRPACRATLWPRRTHRPTCWCCRPGWRATGWWSPRRSPVGCRWSPPAWAACPRRWALLPDGRRPGPAGAAG